MIQINELRVGNWFIGYDGKPFKFEMHHFLLLHNVADLDEIIRETVPLTPEVLEKCGLTFNNTYWYDENIEIPAIPIAGGISKLFITHNRKACYIESLHKLQNIYYDLFQEELKINL